jgi:hypothetical protein
LSHELAKDLFRPLRGRHRRHRDPFPADVGRVLLNELQNV